MTTSISKLILFVTLFGLPVGVTADEDKAKRDLVLEYLEYVGVVDSIALQIETMFDEYVEYYSYLPKEFWIDPRVVAMFDDYKVSLLRGYTETIEEEVSDEDLAFLVEFYASEDGRKVVALGKKLNPRMVAANSDAGKQFSKVFTDLLENDAN